MNKSTYLNPGAKGHHYDDTESEKINLSSPQIPIVDPPVAPVMADWIPWNNPILNAQAASELLNQRHDDLKEMLDSNRDGLKLEAMKRIIGMIAKGRDASELFPAVVKNVVSKNIEVKKLVYVYLVRYAEQQQDLALLSISTFQRALKDPNQLIRAGALRVLSSIRVPMIVPIVMLAIREASVDMSPYVRKTAAHAIPKLYSVDPEQKTELIEVIERLLGDRSTLVVGSAVMAFEEVCPDRIDLIHRNYRKLCRLLVDVDEWGQVIILNMLTRYARSEFTDPNLNDNVEIDEKNFYESSDSAESETEEKKEPVKIMDPDHRLLLQLAKPLLQSRNSSVVIAVVELYHHTAPHQDVIFAVKALIRLLRSHTEVQSIVLHAIASISHQRKTMFEPYLKNFYVRTSDPTHIKLLKLEILTNLATDSNVYMILLELQTYILSSDKKFVAASIQAIGRCACNTNEIITETCLNGLVTLLSSKDEAVVAESVIVIKRLLQTQTADPIDIITHMARLLDNITVPQARAAILWLLGEHCKKVKKIAPDVLRKLAKSFIDEHDIVKLQVLNLAVKLWLTNREQIAILCQYVFNLARYDQSYDIRDRARFLRQFTLNSKTNNILSNEAKNIFLISKPAPLLESRFKDREQFLLGSLSHYINSRAAGYRDLPPFAIEPSPSHLRTVSNSEGPNESLENAKCTFYVKETNNENQDQNKSQDEESSEEDSSSIASSDSNSESEKKSETSSNNDDSSEEEVSDSEEETSSNEKNSKSGSDENDSDNSTNNQKIESKENDSKENLPKPKNNLDLLLDIDFSTDLDPSILTPSLGGFLSPLEKSSQQNKPVITTPVFVPQQNYELLNKINSNGLDIKYRFTRSPHIFSNQMVSIELIFENCSKDNFENIRIKNSNLPTGTSLHNFSPIKILHPNKILTSILGVDFNDTMQSISLEIISTAGIFNVELKPFVGELIQPIQISASFFDTEQKRLRGMYENQAEVKLSSKIDINKKIYNVANVGLIDSNEDILKFAGQTFKTASIILINIKVNSECLNISTHCEKITIGSMLLDQIVSALK